MEIQLPLLSNQGLILRHIAAEGGCPMNTVRRRLALEAVPRYERKVKRKTKLNQFEQYMRKREKAEHPGTVPATILYREIEGRCYIGGMSRLRAFTRTLPPTPVAHPVAGSRRGWASSCRSTGASFAKAAPLA